MADGGESICVEINIILSPHTHTHTQNRERERGINKENTETKQLYFRPSTIYDPEFTSMLHDVVLSNNDITL